MSHIRDVSKSAVAPYLNECMCQSGLKPHLLNGYIKYGEIPEEPCWKCFMRCIAFKLEVFSSTGEVNVQRWVDLFEYFDRSLAEKCSNFQELDLCEKAYLMHKCAYDELSKQFST